MRNRHSLEVLLEVVLVSVLNVVVVYLAAFVYALNWSGVLTVMVFASVVTASASHYLLMRWLAVVKDSTVKGAIGEGVAVMIVALLASLAVLVVLTYRFNLPMALGISLLSGMLSSLMRHVLSA